MFSNKKLLCIDFLRGLAILMVISTHVKGIIPNCSSISYALVSFGRMGVPLFFVVSACTLYLSWQKRCNESAHLAKFYLRRYFRIAPLYYTGIVLYCAVAFCTHYQATGEVAWPDRYHPLSVITNVLLVHGFYPPGYNNIVPGGWSIATEFLFYMIFPLLISLLREQGIRAWFVFVAVYVTALFTVHGIAASRGFQMHGGNYYWYHSIFNQLPVFLLGITAAHLLQVYLKKSHWIMDVTVAAASILVSFRIWNTPHYSLMMSLLPITTASAFIFLMFLMFRIKERMFEGFLMPICWIGKISFSMYIWHFVVIAIVERTLPVGFLKGKDWSLLGLYLTTVAVTAAISYFSEKFIEANGIRLGKRMIVWVSDTSTARSSEAVS